MALEVLVVDDEADIRELVSGVLEDEGYAVRSAADSSAALDAIDDRRPSLVLLDVWLQGSKMDGLQLLEQIKKRDPTLPILMISGHGNLDTAVAAIREGAVDFIEKPFKADRLLHLVGRATETDRLRRENATLRQQVGPDDQLDGTSVAINTVRATLKRVAPTGSRVMINGPAGVGKEMVDQLGNVLAAFPQGRNPHGDHVEAIVEILAESTRRYLVRQVARGRRKYPNVHLDRPLAADPRIALVGKHPQNLGLGGKWHVGDFIEEDGSAMCLLEQSWARHPALLATE